MLAPTSPSDTRSKFQELLHTAITGGTVPPESSGLGPETIAAIDAIAQQHPEASADLIACAYDVFTREHA